MVAIKNNVPTRTCKPWKPVATKNVLPKEESEMVKGASTYSSSWINVKYTPNKIVIIRDWDALEKLPSIRAWCAHVTLTPEERRIIVFIKGTFQGLNASTPIGGQEQPNSILGERLLWKARRKRKKYHFRSDEKHYTSSKSYLNYISVQALIRTFSWNIPPSLMYNR